MIVRDLTVREDDATAHLIQFNYEFFHSVYLLTNVWNPPNCLRIICSIITKLWNVAPQAPKDKALQNVPHCSVYAVKHSWINKYLRAGVGVGGWRVGGLFPSASPTVLFLSKLFKWKALKTKLPCLNLRYPPLKGLSHKN